MWSFIYFFSLLVEFLLSGESRLIAPTLRDEPKVKVRTTHEDVCAVASSIHTYTKQPLYLLKVQQNYFFITLFKGFFHVKKKIFMRKIIVNLIQHNN